VATAKNLLRHEPAIQVSILFTIISLVLSIPLGLWFWKWPEPADWPLFLVIGALATGGNYAFLRAYAEADAGFLAGFSYLRLIMAIALGYLFFAEVPGPWTLVGAAVILTSAVYIGWREAYLARRGRDV
jgi:drug/metabolite transporter (DMT)-like permease